MRTIATLALAGLALALTACGGSSNSADTTGTGTSSTSSASSTPSTSTSSTTTASTTTAVSGPAPCVAADLSLSFLGQQGATGHGLLGFSLRNSSGHACKTFGYPGILFLDKAGGSLPTQTIRTTHDYFGSAPKVELVLEPGQSASFRIGVTHGMTSTANCTTAYGLQVIPPDDTATLHVQIANGTYECKTASLSPLRPGNSAYR